jgi:hypothetical protein
MDPRAVFLKSQVLVRWQYVTPIHAVAKIRAMHKTCSEPGKYLDCVLEHAEVSSITKEFSTMHRRPELLDPRDFIFHVEEDLRTLQADTEGNSQDVS